MGLMEIKCPICKSSLWIDPAHGRVVDHKASDQPKVALEDFLKSQKQPRGWDDKIARARDEEAKRKAEIEAKFKAAKENPEELKGDGSPSIMWD